VTLRTRVPGILIAAFLGVALGTSPVSASQVVAALSRTTGEGSQFCASVSPGLTRNLGAEFDNVYACGPLPPVTGTAGYGDQFEASPWGFQCTELANRFLWDRWGDSPVHDSAADGYNLVGANFVDTVYSVDHTVAPVKNGTPHEPYLPGDIVSFSGGYEDQGHVAVVTGSTENGHGYGVVTIMSENSPAAVAPGGTTQLVVSNWSLQQGAADVVAKDFLPFASRTPSPSPTTVPPVPANLATVLLPGPAGTGQFACSYCGPFDLDQYAARGFSAGPADIAKLKAFGFSRGYYAATRASNLGYGAGAFVLDSAAHARDYLSWSFTTAGTDTSVEPGTLTHFAVPGIPGAIGISYTQKPVAIANNEAAPSDQIGFTYGRLAVLVFVGGTGSNATLDIQAARAIYQRLAGDVPQVLRI